jgi:putative cardiolipin synthase
MLMKNAPGHCGIEPKTTRRIGWLGAASALILAGCATAPPGANLPKVASDALRDPETTAVGQQFAVSAREHGGQSGYRIINVGVDGFLMRMEMIDAAQRTLDLQYYIFHSDESGRLLTEALVRAADRGVRVRLLIDDGEAVPGDERIFAIAGRPNIQIRVFNPFDYRGENRFLKSTEYLFEHSRLDYRMHNKLLVADNAMALVGGRNIGDQYFQIDPDSQYADDDMFAAGPVVSELSATFDEFWNSTWSVPAENLHAPPHPKPAHEAHPDKIDHAGFDYRAKLDSGEPLAGILAGRLPLIWAHAQVVCDSPDKGKSHNAAEDSRIYQPVARAVAGVQTELLMVSPYVVPSEDEMRLLQDRRAHQVRIRILTNSLETAPELSAHSGYMHYRKELLKDGVELYELRARLGSTRGSGESAKLSRYGNYALHAKLYVLDRRRLFVSSMNLDQRSKRLNTEVGLIIDSPELAQEAAKRFEAMTLPENSYAVLLPTGAPGDPPHLEWRTQENGRTIEYGKEPERHAWQRAEVEFLSLLHLDREL